LTYLFMQIETTFFGKCGLSDHLRSHFVLNVYKFIALRPVAT
jgi:hypothetical protein